jgi:Txe/YoeB family toxin of toxin-antitoxin system
MTWRIVLTKDASKDAEKILKSPLKPKVDGLIAMLRQDPWQTPPPYKNLVGDLRGLCSRRINLKHRLIYQVYEAERTVKILRLWTYCGGLTHNPCHCERSQAIQKYPQRKNWIATPPTEARNDVARES